LRGLMTLTRYLFDRQLSLKQDPNLLKEERHMIKASVPTEASSFVNGGTKGLLRQLNTMAGQILTSRGDMIDDDLRLVNADKKISKDKPQLKLRIKLGSASGVRSGGKGSSSRENSPSRSSSGVSLKRSAEAASSAESTPTTTDGPKLKLKISDVHLTKKKGKNSLPTCDAHDEDDGDTTLGEEDFSENGSDSYDQGLDSSDGEWNALEDAIDNGLGKADEDDEDDEEDVGALEPGSSDSEYDEGTSRTRKRSKKGGSPSVASSSARLTNVASGVGVVSAAATAASPRPRSKLSSSETIYFDEYDDERSLPMNTSATMKQEKMPVEAGSNVLGLKRKAGGPSFSYKDIGPKGIGIGINNSSGVGLPTTPKFPSINGPTKKKSGSATGLTAKDRLRSLLLKRR
ncbi:hypothetical protein BGZ94_005123, partial [Podila epigama]